MDILTSIISIITSPQLNLLGGSGLSNSLQKNFGKSEEKIGELRCGQRQDEAYGLMRRKGKGKKVHTDVQKWQAQAHKMIQEANKLLDDEDHAKTKCFCRSFQCFLQCSPRKRYLTHPPKTTWPSNQGFNGDTNHGGIEKSFTNLVACTECGVGKSHSSRKFIDKLKQRNY
ncbi:unnamed protein product [Prunus armeniaca]|uniref:Uncharacterized protein n=1 Tax=Prunus armeniaca TaxID=36596 RepID=A0A6J5U910_PRUAR|nr:unnamed protein product [Prunus armeniaca]